MGTPRFELLIVADGKPVSENILLNHFPRKAYLSVALPQFFECDLILQIDPLTDRVG